MQTSFQTITLREALKLRNTINNLAMGTEAFVEVFNPSDSEATSFGHFRICSLRGSSKMFYLVDGERVELSPQDSVERVFVVCESR